MEAGVSTGYAVIRNDREPDVLGNFGVKSIEAPELVSLWRGSPFWAAAG